MLDLPMIQDLPRWPGNFLDVLLEVHDEAGWDGLRTDCRLIGINNRIPDLCHRLGTPERLLQEIFGDRFVVAEAASRVVPMSSGAAGRGKGLSHRRVARARRISGRSCGNF
jgi:hypothetical protein